MSMKIPRIRQSETAERWQAVTERAATNSFVYAVLTTKIYCRPSCPSRLARRANVQFYDTPLQAEKAGFRPCKRCRPESAQSPQKLMVERACQDIKDALEKGLKPRLQDLAAQAGFTPSHFHRVFKKQMGVTPGHYLNAILRDVAFPYDVETPSHDVIEVNEVSDLFMYDTASGNSASIHWNEFDDLLAAEKLLPDTIDPRMI